MTSLSVVNPTTGRPVKIGGPVFRKLLQNYVYDFKKNLLTKRLGTEKPEKLEKVRDPETGKLVRLHNPRFLKLFKDYPYDVDNNMFWGPAKQPCEKPVK